MNEGPKNVRLHGPQNSNQTGALSLASATSRALEAAFSSLKASCSGAELRDQLRHAFALTGLAINLQMTSPRSHPI
eukprot:s3019_g2.t1